MFTPDELGMVIKDSLDSVLLSQQYNDKRVAQLTSACIEATVARLAALQKPYKYVVTCMIMQKNGAGMHSASSCFWDNYADACYTLKWENKTLYAMCSAYALVL